MVGTCAAVTVNEAGAIRSISRDGSHERQSASSLERVSDARAPRSAPGGFSATLPHIHHLQLDAGRYLPTL